MATNVNGIGMTYYGKREVEGDGSFIATKWLILLSFPILPLGSYRLLVLRDENSIVYQETQYRAQRVSLRWSQVIGTYIAATSAVGFLVGVWLLVSRLSGP